MFTDVKVGNYRFKLKAVFLQRSKEQLYDHIVILPITQSIHSVVHLHLLFDSPSVS